MVPHERKSQARSVGDRIQVQRLIPEGMPQILQIGCTGGAGVGREINSRRQEALAALAESLEDCLLISIGREVSLKEDRSKLLPLGTIETGLRVSGATLVVKDEVALVQDGI